MATETIPESIPTRGLETYRYLARDSDGTRHRGTMEAWSARGATAALMEQGLAPVRLREKVGLRVELTPSRVRQVELMHFSRQLAAFVRAGVPILEAIDGLADGTDNRTFRRTLYDVNDALRAGLSFTGALAEHPKVFPSYYRSAVLAAERTGNLDSTLDRLADYLERDIENYRKVKSALAYPSVVLFFAFVVVIVLASFVMPRFQSFFASLGGDLPLPTRLLINTVDFLTAWWPLLVGGSAALLVLGAAVARTSRGRLWKDRLLLRLPGFGPLLHTSIVERFCRALGSMAQAAVPLPEALAIAGEGTNNLRFQGRLTEARQRMMEGAGIARPLSETGLFPVAATQMITAGERTGTIEQQLLNAADFYEKELDYRLRRFTTLFEPVVILFAGLIVGFVAIALVSAMYGLLTEIPL